MKQGAHPDQWATRVRTVRYEIGRLRSNVAVFKPFLCLFPSPPSNASIGPSGVISSVYKCPPFRHNRSASRRLIPNSPAAMVKKPPPKPNNAKDMVASTSDAAASAPSKAPPPTAGSVKTSRFKKRKAKADRKKAAVATDAAAEASVSAPTPKPKPATAEADAAATTANGLVTENNGGGLRKKSKNVRARERTKEIAKERAEKGKEKVEEAEKEEERGGTKMAGFIFMCNGQTKPECYQDCVFGLPKGKIDVVERIRPGAMLFLYDFDLKLLYGVYKARTKGGMNLVPGAFHGRFPAQVKFRIVKDCLPLPESSFKYAIQENYNSKGKFTQELSSRQVRKLLALFKPANLHVKERRQPNYVEERRKPNYVEERRQPRSYEERRRAHHYQERRPSPHVEELQRSQYAGERRPPMIVHVPPPEDPYRASHFALPPVEPRHGHSLATTQDDRHIYYQQVPLALEPRRMPLVSEPYQIPPAPEARHVPLVLDPHRGPLALEPRQLPLDSEPYHVSSVPEPPHVPPAYYHHLAPTPSDSYYRPQVDLGHDRVAPRTVAEVTVRDPLLSRDYTALRGENAVHSDRVEELYRPGEIAAHADRVEGLYHSDQLVTHARDLPRHPTYMMAAYDNINPAYVETLQRPITTRANIPGPPVSSLYSFAGAPAYR